MSEEIQRGISRRGFLAGSAAGLTGLVGAGILSGCGSPNNSAGTKSEEGTAELKQAEETLSYDAVVLGSGAAGVMAAYEIAKAGAGSVLMVTKSGNATDSNYNEITGTAAVETSYTKEAGETYTVDDLYQRMISFAHWTVNARLLRNCVELLPSNIDVLNEFGVEVSLLGDRYNIGFVEVHGFVTTNKGEPSNAYLESLGVEIMYGTSGTHILMDGDRAVGVQAEDKNGKVIDITAKAVCVATGGYIANEEMMKEVFGDMAVVNMGSRNNTGDGERMVLEVGGFRERISGLGMNDIYGMSEKAAVQSVFSSNPFMQLAFYGGLLVDERGQRFMNEYMLAQEPMAGGGDATMHVARYHAIFSENVVNAMKEASYYANIGSPAVWTSAQTMFSQPIPDFETNLEAALEEGWCLKGSSIADLAEQANLAGLEATVTEYDEMVAAGKDTLFNKRIELLQPIEDGSTNYYLFEYNPSAFNSFGGPRTDDHCRVLTASFDVIPGLYMAGVENGSLYSSPYYDVGGTCSGLALASGRVAGKDMAEYITA
ncbi:MAG: FAD-binding protein [Raoultibacter sp.]|jgi:fumarate reductase flavoprotein subunit